MTTFNAGHLSLAAVRLSDVDLGLKHMLDASELDRAAAFRLPEQRHRFVAGRIALRLHISALTGDTPGSLRANYRCPSCRSGSNQGHGIPHYQLPSRSKPLRASLSRSGNWCLLATSLDDNLTGLGIDIEGKSSADFDGFESLTMTANERREHQRMPPSKRVEFKARLWVRKEAILKALGTGLAIDPSRVDVSGSDPVVLSQPPTSGHWHLEDIDPANVGLPDHLAGALAVIQPSFAHSKRYLG